MTMEECYLELGGDYAEVCGRLPSESMIARFAGRFLEDSSFETLCRALEDGNREEAFRAAHTLKGVCANLSFTALQQSAGELTELLRQAGDTVPETAYALLEDVRRDYRRTADAIRRYRGEA